MNFNSPEFFLFFPTVLLLYAVTFERERARDGLLLACSYAFYMSWNWRYAGLILFSTAVDYLVGRRMGGEEDDGVRRRLLVASMTLNLGLLGFFKYHNFFVDSVGEGLVWLGFHPEVDRFRHRFLLPVGISFYTFQSLSYTIDLYRREIAVERSFIRFALFVAFFPQLVAGPIVRAADFLPQLRVRPRTDRDLVLSGTSLMFRGLFKKVVLADLLAALGVDAVFAEPAGYSSLTLLLALYGYAFQIYNDFSGYSDIAIGAGRILGYRLPDNFNRPYLAQNVRDFWSRWHISLSTWLRDYLYIPLGGNRGSGARVRANLMITMVLGGLWHGAAWNFVFWGAWHGLLLIAARKAPRAYEEGSVGRAYVRRFLTFHLIVLSWLLFRIGSISDLGAYLLGMARLSGGLSLSPAYLAVLSLAVLAHFTPKTAVDRPLAWFTTTPTLVQAGVYAALIVLFAGLSIGSPAFIYFQF